MQSTARPGRIDAPIRRVMPHRKGSMILPDGTTEPESINPRPMGPGIFDCDGAYRTPTRADYERVLKSGMVVLDTNVLLNLYRSNERTRKDTLAVLNRIQEQLWIPHQVLLEFWRNRDLPSVRGHHQTKARDAISALNKVSRSADDALGRWMKDVHLNNDEEARGNIDEVKLSLSNALEQLKTLVKEQAEKDALEGTASTQTDPVLRQLEPLLQGRIGNPLPTEELEKATKEAQRRATEKIPPGYEDFDSKPPAQAAGDYILWMQLLEEAATRQCDVLLVTGDIKEDWWIPGDNQVPARPRTELTIELRTKSSGGFFMLTPSQLLARADEVFGLEVDERSVSDLATTERKHWTGNLPDGFLGSVAMRLLKAHVSALDATRAAITNAEHKQVYGSVMSSFAREEVCDEAILNGGSIIRIAGTEYPILNGHLIIPYRYGNRSTSPSETRLRVSTSRRLKQVFQGYMKYVEYLDGKSLPSSKTPRSVGSSNTRTAILVLFASSADEGISLIEWVDVQLEADGDFTWGTTVSLRTTRNP